MFELIKVKSIEIKQQEVQNQARHHCLSRKIENEKKKKRSGHAR